MTILIIGMALWTAAHLFKAVAPAQRAALDGRIGAGPARGAMAALLALSLVLIVIGYQNAEPVFLWFAPPWLWHVNNLLMLVAFLVFGAGHSGSNIRRFVSHPQLAGVKIWAFAHLLVNGDLPSLVLFGGMIGWAVAEMIAINRRDGKPAAPPAAPLRRDLVHIGVSIALFVAIAFVHRWLGVSPFPV